MARRNMGAPPMGALRSSNAAATRAYEQRAASNVAEAAAEQELLAQTLQLHPQRVQELADLEVLGQLLLLLEHR